MFLAKFQSCAQPYTSQFNAERALALHIKKKCSTSLATIMPFQATKFHEHVSREEYGQALEAWNGFAKVFWSGNSLFEAIVVKCEIDKPFV